MNCGAKLSDTAKFCGSCGAKVEPLDVPASAPADVSANPVQTMQTANTVPSAQTNPVHLGKAELPAQSTVTNGAPSFIPSEVDSHADSSENSGSFGSFASRQPFTAPQNGEEIQPVRYSAEIPPVTSIAAPKKKNRLIPGLCIAAGAVVVLGGAGAVFYNCNKPLVSKLLMGDAGYAHSVTMNALSAVSENSEMITNLTRQSMSAGIMAAESAGVLKDSVANGDGSDGSFGAIDEDFGQSMESTIGKALEYAAWQINHATGTRGVTADFSMKAELSPNVTEAAKAEFSTEEYAEIEKILNNLDFGMTISEKDSGGALEYSADISACGGSIGNAQLRYEEDGTATLILPGMSATGFTAQLPAHSMTENAPEVSFDFSKLYGSISSGMKDAFKDFEIKCENGTTELGTLKFSGMTVQMDLDKDDLCNIALVVINAARNDEGLTAYLTSVDDSMTAEKLAEGFDMLAEELEEWRVGSNEASAQIVYYINSDNTLAGADFTVFGSNDRNVQLRCLTQGNNAELLAAEDGEAVFQAHVVSDSATSGSATASFVNESYDGSREEVSFTVNYSDLGTANVFGMPVRTGTFAMNFPAEDTRRFIDEEMNLDIPDEIIGNVGGSDLVLNIAPNGSGLKVSFTASAEGLGTLTYSAGVSEASGDVAPKSGSEYKLVNIEDISEDDITAFSSDLEKYYSALAESNPLVNAVISLQNTIGNAPDSDYGFDMDYEDDYDWDDDYYWDDDEWDYSDTAAEITDADITAANATAQRMKNYCTTYLTMMDAQKLTPGAKSAEIIIFAWGDEEWKTYVNGYDNSDFTGYQYISNWSDGKDHWGATPFLEDDVPAHGPDENNFTDYVSKLMPDVDDGCFLIIIQDGSVLGVTYITDYYSADILPPSAEDYQYGSWDFGGSDRAGVVNGSVVGTAPVLALESSVN